MRGLVCKDLLPVIINCELPELGFFAQGEYIVADVVLVEDQLESRLEGQVKMLFDV